jgi:hypothetical protein
VAGLSIVSRWGGRASESLFAILFPCAWRICGTPRVTISRLPVCDECLASMGPIAGCLCSVCGERISSPYAVSGIDGEPRCRLCRCIPLRFPNLHAPVLHRAGASKVGVATGARTLKVSTRGREIARRDQEGDEEIVPLAQAAGGKQRGVRRTFVWRDAVRLP